MLSRLSPLLLKSEKGTPGVPEKLEEDAEGVCASGDGEEFDEDRYEYAVLLTAGGEGNDDVSDPFQKSGLGSEKLEWEIVCRFKC